MSRLTLCPVLMLQITTSNFTEPCLLQLRNLSYPNYTKVAPLKAPIGAI
ncbi:hypothetical protein VHP8226_03529 [Vibrio hippocampi]|uniref:Uncharacterized protein n=1 Tax=Vibrio hippocampi TaxID=654686 RepID=A0ABM8ZMN5_9VIBR|nr:hypothetical protein VHP8226_03529 [Vibrio hippocampi]